MASTDRLQFPFDLHDKLMRLLDLSVLHDLVLDLSFPQYVVPADALRGRARPSALSVCIGLAAFRPDRAVLHRGSVPIDADVMHATGYIAIRTPLAERSPPNRLLHRVTRAVEAKAEGRPDAEAVGPACQARVGPAIGHAWTCGMVIRRLRGSGQRLHLSPRYSGASNRMDDRGMPGVASN